MKWITGKEGCTTETLLEQARQGPRPGCMCWCTKNYGCRVTILAAAGPLDFLRQRFPFSFDPVIDLRPGEISYRFPGMDASLLIEQGQMGIVLRGRFDILSFSSGAVRRRKG